MVEDTREFISAGSGRDVEHGAESNCVVGRDSRNNIWR
jgi:hypothetical protein